MNKYYWGFLAFLLFWLAFNVLTLNIFPVLDVCGDEALIGNAAWTWLTTGQKALTAYPGSLGNVGPLWGVIYYGVIAFAFKVFGFGIAVLRGTSLFWGALTLVLTFFLGRALNGERTGLISAIILGSSYIFMASSHLGRFEAAASCFATGGLLLAYLAFKRRSGGLALLSGFVFGLSILVHSVPTALFAGAALFCFLQRRYRDLGLMAAGYLAGFAFLPLLNYAEFFKEATGVHYYGGYLDEFIPLVLFRNPASLPETLLRKVLGVPIWFLLGTHLESMYVLPLPARMAGAGNNPTDHYILLAGALMASALWGRKHPFLPWVLWGSLGVAILFVPLVRFLYIPSFYPLMAISCALLFSGTENSAKRVLGLSAFLLPGLLFTAVSSWLGWKDMKARKASYSEISRLVPEGAGVGSTSGSFFWIFPGRSGILPRGKLSASFLSEHGIEYVVSEQPLDSIYGIDPISLGLERIGRSGGGYITLLGGWGLERVDSVIVYRVK